MAVTSIMKYFYGVSPDVVIKKSTSSRRRPMKNMATMSIIASNHKSIINCSSIQMIRLPSKKNKVFEDQSKGIVCYREENGEITCEGIDEGPRFHRNISSTAASQTTRDADMVDLLHRCWPHIADKAKF